MFALPPGLTSGALQVTGMSCPECLGVLGAHVEGRHDTLLFECRVGHSYDLPGLLAVKEDVLEQRLWAAATALSELSALMADLERGARGAAEAAMYRDRAARAQLDAASLLDVIGANRPIELSAVVPASGGPAAGGAVGAGGGQPGA